MTSPAPQEYKLQCSNGAAEELESAWCKNKFCLILHWLVLFIILCASFFTGVSQSDLNIWNMTLYCNEEKFNKVHETVDKKWAVFSVVLTCFTIAVIIFVKMFISGQLVREMFHMINYFTGLLISWVFCFLLQTIISYPIPSYFQNKKLRDLYCQSCCPLPEVTKYMRRLDKEARGSFPSFLICSSTYVTIYLYLLCANFDSDNRYGIKLFTLVVPGTITFVTGWFMCQYNENHIQDVIGGAVIGAFFAGYIAWDTFIAEKKERQNKFVAVFHENTPQVSQSEDEEFETGPNNETGDDDGFLLRLYLEGGTRSADLNEEMPPPPYASVVNA